MTNKNVPFYPNTEDDTHCYQAALKMLLKYFLPEKEYSWEELEKFSAKKEGLSTWPTQAYMNLLKMGFEIIDMDEFDNQRFIKLGESYLIEKFGEEVARWQVQMSDLAQERRLMEEYETYHKHQFKLPEIEDIKKSLDQGFLVMCTVNSEVLNHKSGYIGHIVLIYGYDDKNLYLHDPGLPPIEARKVSYEEFRKAWESPNEGARNMAAFKYDKN